MNENLYTALIGQITKKGKKLTAANILNRSLINLSKKSKISVLQVFKLLCKKLGSVIEIKTVKLRKNVHIIPFPLKNSRRLYLIAKNLVSTIQSNKSKLSFDNKIVEEIFSLSENRHSKSVQKKNLLVKQAINNKSNIHYRWN